MEAPGKDIKDYDGLALKRRVLAVFAVSMAVVLAVMDGTIMNVALPTLTQEMGLKEADTIWIVNGYQVAIIMLLLSMSTIGEVFSYKRIFLLGVAVFTLASLLCAAAPDFSYLVLGRILQGVGASGMMAVNMTLLRLSYPRAWLGRGIGLNATIVALASVIGPSLSGIILSLLNWRYLFIINLPIGLLCLMIGIKALPKNIVKIQGRSLPRKDMILNALFFGCSFMFLEGLSHDFPIWAVLLLLGLAIASGIHYIGLQRRREFPLLPIDLLKIRLFSLSVLTSIASFTAQMLCMVSLPFLMVTHLGLSQSETGFLFSAWPLSIMIAAPVSGYLIGKVNAGAIGGLGLLMLSLGAFSLTLLPQDPSYWDIMSRLMLCGAGFGLFQSPNNNILMTSAPQSRSGSASGMLAMARLTGQTTGATLVALLFMLTPDKAPIIALYGASLAALSATLLSASRINGLKKAG